MVVVIKNVWDLRLEDSDLACDQPDLWHLNIVP